VRRRKLKVTEAHRLRGSLITAGIALGVLALGLGGGALSGKLEHRASGHPTGSLPPVETEPSSTSVVPATTSTLPPGLTPALSAQVIEDMTLDVNCQRLDPDKSRRAALASTPAAVATRHHEIATAWVPEKAAGIATMYDRQVHANALDPTANSVTHAQFVVVRWYAVTGTSTAATVLLIGHYLLTEPSGLVELNDQPWAISVRMSGGRWKLVDRSAA
jgi:hypothetical protein